MKKNWLIAIAVILFLLLAGLVFKLKFWDRQLPAALQVSASPRAVVFIDEVQVGVADKMGYANDKIEPGEHRIRLVPESSEAGLTSWETKIDFVPGVRVFVNRFLGPNDAESAGEILTLEKISQRQQAPLAVVSSPDQAVVKIDGEPRGFTPLVIEDEPPGKHDVVIGSPGYRERQVAAKTVAGYKLVIDVQLAREIEGIAEATESAELTNEPSPTEAPQEEATKETETEAETALVKIKDTPTGWLRVREAPSTTAAELTKVDTGETFPYLGETKNGWHKIEYETDKAGWVSGIYSEVVEPQKP